MSRIMVIASVSFAVASISWSQTIYSLTPDTKGNQVALTIANASSFVTAEQVEAKVGKHPGFITFTSIPKQISSIAPTKETTITFGFDVGRVAATNKRDTLEFLISDKTGPGWTKSIIVSYSGPSVYALDQNFPNPFNPSTTIQYQLPVDSRVSLKLYDVLGREVASLVNDARPAGYHDVQWNAKDVASGVYFCRIEAQPLGGGQGLQSVKKLVVMK